MECTEGAQPPVFPTPSAPCPSAHHPMSLQGDHRALPTHPRCMTLQKPPNTPPRHLHEPPQPDSRAERCVPPRTRSTYPLAPADGEASRLQEHLGGTPHRCTLRVSQDQNQLGAQAARAELEASQHAPFLNGEEQWVSGQDFNSPHQTIVRISFLASINKTLQNCRSPGAKSFVKGRLPLLHHVV